MPGRLASRKPLAFHRLIGFPCGVWPGLGVSLGQFFQDSFIQHEIRYHLLELGVFLFEFLELLGLVHLQATVPFPPTVVGERCDLKLSAGLFDGTTLGLLNLGLTKNRNNLLGTVFLSRHKAPFFSLPFAVLYPLRWTSFWGAGQGGTMVKYFKMFLIMFFLLCGRWGMGGADGNHQRYTVTLFFLSLAFGFTWMCFEARDPLKNYRNAAAKVAIFFSLLISRYFCKLGIDFGESNNEKVKNIGFFGFLLFLVFGLYLWNKYFLERPSLVLNFKRKQN